VSNATVTAMDVFKTLAWVVSGVLFISSLRGLASQETARRGNGYGIVGMALAIVAMLVANSTNQAADAQNNIGFLIGALTIGAAVGVTMAQRVAMTAMPEMVAILHSFVGLAAVLVGYAAYLEPSHAAAGTVVQVDMAQRVEIWLDVLIGAITFTGSIVAFLKLRGSLSGKPLLLPGRHMANLLMFTASLAMVYPFATMEGTLALPYLLGMSVLACILGVHLVAAIGGADMPVVVSMLNSYSGWTAAAAGFMLDNNLLIITGALVGSSGAILSTIMCRAMNRSIWSVIFGGFGADQPSGGGMGAKVEGEMTETTIDELTEELRTAKQVIIVPGFGMAAARAQHAVRQLVDLLRKRGVTARFAIHPVAGRLPGHMNVLLAEASVPYDIVLEMDEINQDFPNTDVVFVVGANDIVNPAAQTDSTSPIYGMPVLEVWKAKRVVVLKRSRGAGYAGVDNPLFVSPTTRMLFKDAKDGMEQLVAKLAA
jgi:NAD(P) transhydrogenase subunit beta